MLSEALVPAYIPLSSQKEFNLLCITIYDLFHSSHFWCLVIAYCSFIFSPMHISYIRHHLDIFFYAVPIQGFCPLLIGLFVFFFYYWFEWVLYPFNLFPGCPLFWDPLLSLFPYLLYIGPLKYLTLKILKDQSSHCLKFFSFSGYIFTGKIFLFIPVNSVPPSITMLWTECLCPSPHIRVLNLIPQCAGV